MKTTRVKICGITNKKDLQAAVRTGADAVGFITGVKSSPRNLTLGEAKDLIYQVPLFVHSVVVMVPNNVEEIKNLINNLRPNVIQIHGNLNAHDFSVIKEEYPNLFLIKAIKAVPQKINKRAVEALKKYDAILLDSYTKGKYGGTGIIHDWDLSLKIKQIIHPIPMILAGGLKPENVAEAIDYVQPYAVDVSSGVEKKPGIKDYQKICDFINRAREIRK